MKSRASYLSEGHPGVCGLHLVVRAHTDLASPRPSPGGPYSDRLLGLLLRLPGGLAGRSPLASSSYQRGAGYKLDGLSSPPPVASLPPADSLALSPQSPGSVPRWGRQKP